MILPVRHSGERGQLLCFMASRPLLAGLFVSMSTVAEILEADMLALETSTSCCIPPCRWVFNGAVYLGHRTDFIQQSVIEAAGILEGDECELTARVAQLGFRRPIPNDEVALAEAGIYTICRVTKVDVSIDQLTVLLALRKLNAERSHVYEITELGLIMNTEDGQRIIVEV